MRIDDRASREHHTVSACWIGEPKNRIEYSMPTDHRTAYHRLPDRPLTCSYLSGPNEHRDSIAICEKSASPSDRCTCTGYVHVTLTYLVHCCSTIGRTSVSDRQTSGVHEAKEILTVTAKISQTIQLVSVETNPLCERCRDRFVDGPTSRRGLVINGYRMEQPSMIT